LKIEEVKDRAINSREAAELLGISLATLYRMTSNGSTFPKGTKIGRARRWWISDLVNWMERRAGK